MIVMKTITDLTLTIKSVQTKSFLLLMFASLMLSACTTTSISGKPYGKSDTVRRGDDKAQIHARLAEGYLTQKQYAVAKEELEKALKINPNHSQSNYMMALLMVELQQYKTADVHFAQAVETNRNNSAAAHDYGTFLCQTGEEMKAVKYFEIAVSNPLFNKSELSYMRAGECLSRAGDKRAEQYLKKALSINSQMRPALFRLAQIKFDEASFFSARAYIERYFAITKPQPDSLLLAYKIESALNANDVAAGYRTQLLDEFPGSIQASQLRRQNR